MGHRIELEAVSFGMTGSGRKIRRRWPRNVFRFKRGQYVWVRDRGTNGGFRIVEARVRERHLHLDRHPFYPNGEGYALDGDLWWDCYPGCRVFATRTQAVRARLGEISE